MPTTIPRRPARSAATQKVKPTTREWSAPAKNFVAYANQSGRYDEVAEYLKRLDLF